MEPSRLLPGLVPGHTVFRSCDEVAGSLEKACAANADLASFECLGESEEGRPIHAVALGKGPERVSLLAGSHADEPVGPETLRTLVLEGLRRRGELAALFERFRFLVVPHLNPDGEARNRDRLECWPDPAAILGSGSREPPGRDLEFGYPAMRAENRCVAGFLRAGAPFVLHMSLHGMAVSEGAMLLIERHWSFRTQELRDRFAAAARTAGLGLHDHNRKGEKGFFYLEPGFTTTPEGEAMRTWFRARGDEVTAARFHSSSMEYVRGLGGDPLCLVTELPLFVVPNDAPVPGLPTAYLALRERMARGEVPRALRPLDPGTAMRLQFTALGLGLEAVAGSG